MSRGDVVRVRPPRGRPGPEQEGERFAVVVQTDVLERWSTIVVAPTSTSAAARSFRPVVDLRGTSTRVLVDQMMAVDASRIGRRVARLRVEEVWALDDAVGFVVGL